MKIKSANKCEGSREEDKESEVAFGDKLEKLVERTINQFYKLKNTSKHDSISVAAVAAGLLPPPGVNWT